MRGGHHLTPLGSDGEQNLGQAGISLELAELFVPGWRAGGVSAFREQGGTKPDSRAQRG